MIVNGAVIGRGDEPGSFLIYNQAKLLRGREIIQEEDADTLGKKLYLAIQLLYLFPEDEAEITVKYHIVYSQLTATMLEKNEELSKIHHLVSEKEYYRALKLAGKLIE